MASQIGAKRLDLVGQVFGDLTVLAPAPNIGERTAWLCQCSCGTVLQVKTKNLRNGKSAHCGCKRQSNLANLHYVDGTCLEMLRTTHVRKNNRSGCTGVFYDKRKGKWRAEIMLQGKRYSLGYFQDFPEAQEARLAARAELHGPFIESLA